MDWRRELREKIGVFDEGNAVDLSDMEGRDFLNSQDLERLKEEQPANMDVAGGDSTV